MSEASPATLLSWTERAGGVVTLRVELQRWAPGPELQSYGSSTDAMRAFRESSRRRVDDGVASGMLLWSRVAEQIVSFLQLKV